MANLIGRLRQRAMTDSRSWRYTHQVDTICSEAADALETALGALRQSQFYFVRLKSGDIRGNALSFADVLGDLSTAIARITGETK